MGTCIMARYADEGLRLRRLRLRLRRGPRLRLRLLISMKPDVARRREA
jgi:hypothetical protein